MNELKKFSIKEYEKPLTTKHMEKKVNATFSEEEKERPKKDLVKTEINIERNPIFATTRFQGNSREIIRGVMNDDDGSEVQSKITIGKIIREDGQIVEVGVLNTSHLKVFYGVLKLWQQQSLNADGVIRFSRNELQKIMGRKGGWVSKRIKQWVMDLATIPLLWEHSFYDAQTGEHLKSITGFHFIESYEIFTRSKKPNTPYFTNSKIQLNGLVVKNILNKGGKNLRFDTILNLKSETALLLYRFLDWKMSHQEKLEKNLKDLFEEMGLDTSSKYYRYPSNRKQAIEDAVKELEGKEISTGVLHSFSIEPMRDGNDFKLVVEKRLISQAITAPVGKDEARTERIEYMVNQIIEVCGDEHSRTAYRLIAEKMSDSSIFQALSETKDASARDAVHTTRAKYFMDTIKRYAQQRGIDLFS